MGEACNNYNATIPHKYRDAIRKQYEQGSPGQWDNKTVTEKLDIAVALLDQVKQAVDAEEAAAAAEKEAEKEKAISNMLAMYTMQTEAGLVLTTAGIDRLISNYAGPSPSPYSTSFELAGKRFKLHSSTYEGGHGHQEVTIEYEASSGTKISKDEFKAQVSAIDV